MKDGMKSLSRKSIIRLVALGIILFLGTGLAGGIQLYRQNLKVYSEAARSYASMLRYQVEQDNIDQIAALHEDLGKLQEKLRSYMAGGDSDSEAYGKILNETEEELVNLFGEWYEIESFVLGFGNICRDIEYAYVVIPTKNDLIYLWDSEYVGVRIIMRSMRRMRERDSSVWLRPCRARDSSRLAN